MNTNHCTSLKTTAARNRVALSYHSVRGLYFLAVVFAATIIHLEKHVSNIDIRLFICLSFSTFNNKFSIKVKCNEYMELYRDCVLKKKWGLDTYCEGMRGL